LAAASAGRIVVSASEIRPLAARAATIISSYIPALSGLAPDRAALSAASARARACPKQPEFSELSTRSWVSTVREEAGPLSMTVRSAVPSAWSASVPRPPMMFGSWSRAASVAATPGSTAGSVSREAGSGTG